MIRGVMPRLCIRCKGRSTSATISICEYWGRDIKISPREENTFECSYGQKNQYTIDEWIIQLRDSVWRYVKPEDPITIKIYDWGYTLNTLPRYGPNPFISEKCSGDIEKEGRRIVDLLTGGKTPVEVQYVVGE